MIESIVENASLIYKETVRVNLTVLSCLRWLEAVASQSQRKRLAVVGKRFSSNNVDSLPASPIPETRKICQIEVSFKLRQFHFSKATNKLDFNPHSYRHRSGHRRTVYCHHLSVKNPLRLTEPYVPPDKEIPNAHYLTPRPTSHAELTGDVSWRNNGHFSYGLSEPSAPVDRIVRYIRKWYVATLKVPEVS